MLKSIHGRPYLAFDFGAESGRAVLAHLQSGILTTEEVHRFANEPVEYGGSLHWDVARLWFEVRKTLTRLNELELAGIGIDAWGVDYALLGEGGELLQNPYHYRDGGSPQESNQGRDLRGNWHPVHADQHFVSTFRGATKDSQSA